MAIMKSKELIHDTLSSIRNNNSNNTEVDSGLRNASHHTVSTFLDDDCDDVDENCSYSSCSSCCSYCDDNNDDDRTIKRVTFGAVQVYCHSVCLGDHPACSDGYCPLALDYDSHYGQQHVYVHTYDQAAGTKPSSPPRRIPRHRRYELLLQQQHERKHHDDDHNSTLLEQRIQAVQAEIRVIQESRRRSQLDDDDDAMDDDAIFKSACSLVVMSSPSRQQQQQEPMTTNPAGYAGVGAPTNTTGDSWVSFGSTPPRRHQCQQRASYKYNNSLDVSPKPPRRRPMGWVTVTSRKQA